MAERVSKLVRLALVQSCKSDEVAQAIEETLAEHKGNVLTLTMDNGSEFFRHKTLGKDLLVATKANIQFNNQGFQKSGNHQDQLMYLIVVPDQPESKMQRSC